jgi:hypothetical protein
MKSETLITRFGVTPKFIKIIMQALLLHEKLVT